MTLTEAKQILGLGPEEDPRPKLEEFQKVRKGMVDAIKGAPNKLLRKRGQKELNHFDKALAVVRENIEAKAGVSGEKESAVPASENQGEELENTPKSKKGKGFIRACWLLLILVVVCLSGWTFLKIKEKRDLADRARIVFLEKQGSIFIEGRSWVEAREAFDEIEKIDPDSDLVIQGRRGIEAGMLEERNQFVGYWKGEAISAFEANLLVDAETAANKVLAKYPQEKELLELISKIDEAKEQEKRKEAFEKVRAQIGARKFDEAVQGAKILLASKTGDEDAAGLLREAESAKAKAQEDLELALELLAKTEASDTGEYNEEALAWMREAVSLAPENDQVVATYEKIAAYTRTIRVPEDIKTLEEALAMSKDKDRILLAAGTWKGPLLINSAVKLEGVPGKTVIRCAAAESSVITIAPSLKDVSISGITMRHLSFDDAEERFSLVLVRGSKVDFIDCRFESGGGHGLAIIEGGRAKVSRCRFTENGWNGVAVQGLGSVLEADASSFTQNFQNGIESWDGAAVILRKNICKQNTRNGVHLDNGASSAIVRDNVFSGNHEYGMILSSAESGEISGNTIEDNTLGGIVGMVDFSPVEVTRNTISKNEGPGLILERGSIKENYLGNLISENRGDQLVYDVDFATE